MSDAETPLVLLVDDEPPSLLLLQRHVGDAGYRTLTAQTGRQALQVAMHEGPSIIITDWMMPDLNGIEVCRVIRADAAFGTPFIILITAHSAPETMTEAFEAGVDDFLRKPIDRKELLARLRGAGRITGLQKDLERRRLEVHRANAQIQLAADQLADANRRLRSLASTDALTGLMNRREALVRLTESWSLARRYGDPLSCIMVDIDHFKQVNDTHGHKAGDHVLAETAKILKRSARAGEAVARLGGEEFLIVCPTATEEQAAVAAERFRSRVAAHCLTFDGTEISVTISAGVAETRDDLHRAEDVLQAADEALYAAKAGGRNQVRCAQQLGGQSPAAPAMAPAADASLDPPGFPGGPDMTIHVLVIDDCADRRDQWSRMLTGRAFDVIEAPSVAEAAPMLRAHRVGAVFLSGTSSSALALEWNRLIENEGIGVGIPVMYVPSHQGGGGPRGASGPNDEKLDAGERALSALSEITETLAHVGMGADHERQSEQARTMALLVDFSRQLIAARSLEDVIERTISVASELTTSLQAALLTPDDQGEHLVVAAAVGLDEASLTSLRIPICGTSIGEMLSEREPVLLNSAGDVEKRGHLLGDEHPTVPPAIVAPLRAADRLVGVLYFARRYEKRAYTAYDLEYLDLLSNLAASAIQDHVAREACDVARDSIVSALAALAETRDNDTGRHLERVTAYCTILANEMRADPECGREITDEFIADLTRAVPLHDIGKVAVPDRILLKPGRLTDGEREVMRQHSTLGADTIRSVVVRARGVSFLEMAEAIARHHHERWNGEGYPCRLAGRAIPLAARIVSVADVYDAITSRRVYKSAMSHESATAFIQRGSGTHFDPAVVDAFVRQENEFRRLCVELGDPLEEPTPETVETHSPKYRVS
jgi:diguanylate cyclase (GGDEF)-like protein